MIGRGLLLTLRLFMDKRVSVSNKLLPIIAVVYMLSPLDVLPDASALGFVDDIGLIIWMFGMFVQNASPEIVQEHLEALSTNDRLLREIKELDDTPDDR